MTIKADELRKQIYYIVFDSQSGKVDAILQAFHDAGGVMLAENQTPPISDAPNYLSKIGYDIVYHYGAVDQREISKVAGFKRVEPLFAPNPVST